MLTKEQAREEFAAADSEVNAFSRLERKVNVLADQLGIWETDVQPVELASEEVPPADVPAEGVEDGQEQPTEGFGEGETTEDNPQESDPTGAPDNPEAGGQ